jgi:hypothetical protein
MKRFATYLALLLAAGAVHAQQKPVAYNSLSAGARTPMDQAVHDALDSKFDIVDFDLSKHAYVPPHPTAGSMPHTPTGDDGNPIHGNVTLAYVITAEGYVVFPTIVKCSTPVLCQMAVAVTHHWRFDSATLDGNKVSTTAMQDFKF